MTGVIVAAHGGLAEGLEKNVKMLAGSDIELTTIDFYESMSTEDLDEKVTAAFDKYKDCGCTMVLCDLAGGTPYNRAATLSVADPKVRVLSGVNTAMLLCLVMKNVVEEEIEDIDALADELIDEAKSGVGKFSLTVSNDDMGMDEEGI